MTIRQSVVRTVVFTALYVVATYAGRLTIMDGTNLSLVWPAAGISALWFICQRSSRWRSLDVAALAAATVAVNMATGAGPALSGFFVVANLLQAATFTVLYQRWLPGLWGSGGTAPVARPHQLWRLVAIAIISTFCGALVGPTGVWLVSGHYSAPAAAVWMARNSASMLLIGIAGLRLGALAGRFTGTPRQRWPQLCAATRTVPGRTWVEGGALLIVSAGAYLAVFGFTHGLPLAFVLVTITVWAATRMSTTFVILHDLFFGSLAVVFTLHGNGQFAGIASHTSRALVSQMFVAVVAIVGLAVALGRDERVALQRAAAEQARVFATIFDAMGEGLAVLDADGHFLLRNPASSQLLGGLRSPTGRMAGNDFYGLRHLDGTPVAPGDLPHQRALATGDPHAMDILVSHPAVPGGRILSVRATPLPVDVGGRRYAVSVFSDVTADRRHRDELAAFAGIVAHDLSNPLTTVEGWAEDVADLLGPDAGRAGDGIARIQRAATRMRNLITDLLAYTTARDAALGLTGVDLTAIGTDIAVARIDQAETTGAPVPHVRIGELPPVHADPALIRQLFDNLIGNAVKYTAPGVVPVITVTGDRDGDRVRIAISDNGIGIPAGQHGAVFDNFHRAHRDAGYTGTGLGLAICKRIVVRHGGTITAADGPAGSGSTFTFTLPAANLPPGVPDPAAPVPERSRLA
ncbi:histidine kinase [Actinoplanes sp. SE50]|uniref:ATP-binding protein n=1 Tax=unclassified Actinoplanes TaxID=2626549 RepID=UPI00023EC0E4|nr:MULTISPECIES: ATP-binding protein [unclassified Actinoplanes]AEV84594.1 Sensor protein kinase walK [Actinoplanes sp. SE50/110]ATO82986.1 histidine kinase [Actinoplanes sp. SE50]SLM00394.1 multi-sensor signal transduction histidine kinase [Actinoplanes sp. SE50/110]